MIGPMQVSLVAFAALAAVAVGAVVVFLLVRRRRGERDRVRTKDLRELEARIAQRVAALTEPPIDDVRGTAAFRAAAAPVAVQSPSPAALPSPVETRGAAEAGPVETPPATVEKQLVPPSILIEPEPVEKRAPVLPAASLTPIEAAPPPAPTGPMEPDEAVPVAATVALSPQVQSTGAVRRMPPRTSGRDRPQRRRRIVARAVAMSAVVIILVLIGSQLLPRLIPHQAAGPLPTPTGIAAASPTATPGVSVTPTAQPTTTPTPSTTDQATISPIATPVIYIVRPGDTMWQIATKFNVPLADLIAANPQIADPNKIYAGNQIKIPSTAP